MQRLLCRHGGKEQKIIAEYIRNQLEEDYAVDQISMKEYIDPFTGARISRLKKKTAARERLPVIVMRCQTSAPLTGVKPVIAP